MAFRSRVSRKWALALLVWLAIFGVSLLRVSFLNDHFDRISRARQILVYGDHPFADFRDPGYFLTLYVSAAAQAATGGSLLGEALVASGAIAAAGALTFWLAESASASWGVGLIAALATALLPPRYYDYDKALFYVLGLALCWRFVDSPGPRRLAAAGFVTGLAALFRYDNGLYILVACLAAIAVRGPRTPRPMLSNLGMYLAGLVVAVLPALLFVHLVAGLPEAARQIAAYAAREGARSELFSLPRLSLDLSSVVYVLLVAAAPAALIDLRLARRAPGPLAFPEAKILAAASLTGCVSIFILRDPIGARLGAAAPAALVLAAWMIGRRVPRVLAGRVALAAAGAIVVFAAMTLEGARLLRAQAAVARRLSAVTTELGSPVPRSYAPEDGALTGLADYLRACTPPDARVLVTWFAPEVYFFSQRGFAGGMAVFLGSHWSSDDDQQRTVEQMTSQRVPLVILQAESADGVRAIFPRVMAFLDARYRVAGDTSFADPRVGADGYRILIRKDLGDPPRDPKWALPCPMR